MQALRGLVDHGPDRIEHLLVGERLDDVTFIAEQEMQRHHPGLRGNRRGVGRGDDGELDVAGFDQLQQLRLLAELRAGILVDQHGALAQLLELVGEQVAGDRIAGVARLVIGKAIMFYLLRACAGREHHRRCGNGQTYRSQ
jgi:hypothetical protein